MISFARDSNNDLFLSSRNDISMNTGLDACLQACESAVSTILGEKIYICGDLKLKNGFSSITKERLHPQTSYLVC